MKQFELKQRVQVVDSTLATHMMSGTVMRMRRTDDGAWVRIDEAGWKPECAEFPEGDSRHRHVILYPNQCVPAGETVNPFTGFIEALRNDREMQVGYHCNIAVAMQDEGVDHGTANRGAERFLRALLGAYEPLSATVPDSMGEGDE